MVCSAAGLATGDYSLPYVASWASGDPAAVRRTAERVVSTSRRILEACGLADPAAERAAV